MTVISTQLFPAYPLLIKRYGEFMAAAGYAWEKISCSLILYSLIKPNLPTTMCVI